MNPNTIVAAARFISELQELLTFVADKKNTKALLGELKVAADELTQLKQDLAAVRESADTMLCEAMEQKSCAQGLLAEAEAMQASCATVRTELSARDQLLSEREQALKDMSASMAVRDAELAELIDTATHREHEAKRIEMEAQQMRSEAEAVKTRYTILTTRLKAATDEAA